MDKNFQRVLISAVLVSILFSSVTGAALGFWAGTMAQKANPVSDWISRRLGTPVSVSPASSVRSTVLQVEEQSSVVNVAEKVSPAVVSIIVTKDLPVIERYYTEPNNSYDFFRRFWGSDFEEFFDVPAPTPQYRQNGTEKTEVGGGSGFLVSADGYIITNRHVVTDEEADYTVLLNDERRFDAKVLARDPVNDLAILKIEGSALPYIEMGNSENLKVGQAVIAIGNALGEFRNTVSTGVISGLSRSIVAGGAGIASEQLTNVIQTDASINPGNSGGPLLNLLGQAIGINTAIVAGAQNIGFAIPSNEITDIYESVRQNGRIVRPWIGVRYVAVNELVKEKNQLSVDYGALIVRGEDQVELAVIPGSPADKAGLLENDIILEVNGEKISDANPLNKAVGRFKPGDTVKLKVLHDGKEKVMDLKLEEMGM